MYFVQLGFKIKQGFYLRHTEFVEHTTIDTLIVLLFTKYRFSVREDISSQLWQKLVMKQYNQTKFSKMFHN